MLTVSLGFPCCLSMPRLYISSELAVCAVLQHFLIAVALPTHQPWCCSSSLSASSNSNTSFLFYEYSSQLRTEIETMSLEPLFAIEQRLAAFEADGIKSIPKTTNPGALGLIWALKSQ